jgi:TonB family protein
MKTGKIGRKMVVCLLLGISSVFLLSNCAYTILEQQTVARPKQHHQTMEQPDCKTMVSDSVILAQSRDSLRSLRIIRDRITLNSRRISSFFLGRDSIFKGSDTIKFGLAVHPNGRFTAYFVKDGIKLDTASTSHFVDSLNKARLDSIPKYVLSAQIILKIKRNAKNNLSISVPDIIRYCEIRGRKSIMATVMQDIKYLRYAYNRRLRDESGLKGKITIKFAIDEFGKVIYSGMLESTMGDTELETEVVQIVKSWQFCPIRNKGDVCEVVYPFVFSQ